MASIDKRPNGTYRARWREYPSGPQKTKHFDRKIDAQRFLDRIRGDLAHGMYTDPSAGQQTFKAYAEDWRRIQPHRAATAVNVEQDLRLHVYPSLGGRPLSSIRTSHVQAMVASQTARLAPSTLERVYGRVSSVFRAAVRDGAIPASPCADVRLPRARSAAVTEVLTTEQVLALADAMPQRYRALILTGAGTGLRPGELFGLGLEHVEFLRRTVRVDRQLVRVRGRGVELAPLKTPTSYRTVPLPQVVGEALATHLAAFSTDDLIFTNERGAPIRQHPFAVTFDTARQRAGLPEWATPHDWRHYYASLLIQSGASVKVVQARLGHASAKTTLDVYGHLWPDEEDRTRQAIDAELFRSAEDQLRTSQGV